jgi:hypothetical protein
MRLKSLKTRGFLDISSAVGEPFLSKMLSPGQIVEIDDTFAGLNNIVSAINAGYLQILSYSTESDSIVIQAELQSHTNASSNVHGITGDVVGTTDEQTLSGKTVSNYGEGVTVIGNCSGSVDLDLNTANIFTATVTGETTFSVINPKASGTASSFVLILTAGGDYQIYWPSTFYWPSGSIPTLTSGGIDLITGMTVDGGTIWHVAVAQSASAMSGGSPA